MMKPTAISSQLILLLMVAKTNAALAPLSVNSGSLSNLREASISDSNPARISNLNAASISNLNTASIRLNKVEQQVAVSQAQFQLEAERSQESAFQSLDRAASEPGSTTDQLNKFTFTAPESIIKGNNHRLNVLQVTQLLQAANISQEAIPSVLKSGFGPRLNCASSLKCSRSSKYRTADGSCNNLAHTSWGKASIPMRRWLIPDYDDGVSSPREKATLGSSSKLPSARLVSTTVHTPSTNADRHASYTHMLMQWGQFLDHDITSTPTQQLSGSPYGGSIGCCGSSFHKGKRAAFRAPPLSRPFNRPQCFPIDIPQPDRHFRSTCMNFVRSVQVANADCQAAPVEQLNQITAYIDASQVYGSSQGEQNKLRTFVDGQLKMKSTHLPSDSKRSCTTPSSPSYCFLAGDHRVNENPTLQSLHTIFMREHNRIARKLKQLNCHWSDERIFQEARKIVGAIIQKITYDEYLPIIMGQQAMTQYGLPIGSGSSYANVYSTTTDASIRNAFATAAFRMGHSMIHSFLASYSSSYSNLGQDQLSKTFGNTNLILNANNRKVDHYCRGLVKDGVQNAEHKLTQEVTDKLFADSNGNSLDLAALNIQRGRDHGLPSYTKWRKYCNVPTATSFAGLASTTHTTTTANLLKSVYKHIDDIDLFPGALSEKPVPGGLLGPTFTCLLGKQFQALKEGDRFWFEENNAYVKFTPNQLNEIRKASLSRVVCDNTDTYKIQKNAFIKGSPVSCGSLGEINLNHWNEPSTGTWNTWTSWGTCYSNRQSRRRSCKTCGCTGQSSQSRKCGGCSWSSWGQWSSCVSGRRSRSRYCPNNQWRGRRRAVLEEQLRPRFPIDPIGPYDPIGPIDPIDPIDPIRPCSCSGSSRQYGSCGWNYDRGPVDFEMAREERFAPLA
ncbi:thyroid peroxidase-like [Haliotis rufescens]|uniref:thyroid peroxidase-like n=1 Tax=Haliotis rufescens TaxID=6454 RepID=UPI00201F75C5|nr:thyroid peroxidase-like [Haliotis rufescens]